MIGLYITHVYSLVTPLLLHQGFLPQYITHDQNLRSKPTACYKFIYIHKPAHYIYLLIHLFK